MENSFGDTTLSQSQMSTENTELSVVLPEIFPVFISQLKKWILLSSSMNETLMQSVEKSKQGLALICSLLFNEFDIQTFNETSIDKILEQNNINLIKSYNEEKDIPKKFKRFNHDKENFLDFSLANSNKRNYFEMIYEIENLDQINKEFLEYNNFNITLLDSGLTLIMMDRLTRLYSFVQDQFNPESILPTYPKFAVRDSIKFDNGKIDLSSIKHFNYNLKTTRNLSTVAVCGLGTDEIKMGINKNLFFADFVLEKDFEKSRFECKINDLFSF